MSLFDRARAGDGAAHAEITRILRTFSRHACRGGGPYRTADFDWEDVAQEAGRRLFGVGLGQYRGEGSERSFLYSLVKSTVIQLARTSRRRQRREASFVEAPARPSIDRGPHPDVQTVLSRLSPECRRVIESIFLEDRSYGELAAELGLRESSVRSRVSRCLRAAREIAGEEEQA